MQLSPYEFSELAGIAEQRARLEAAIANSKGPGGILIGNEYCNTCGCDMGFSINTHVDDPIRFQDGAIYREGAGQTCSECEKTS